MKLNNKIIIVKSNKAYSVGTSYVISNIEVYNKQFKRVKDIYTTIENSIGEYQQARQAIEKAFKITSIEASDILRSNKTLFKQTCEEVGYRELKRLEKAYNKYTNEK